MRIAVVDDNKKEQESLSAAIRSNIEGSDIVIEQFDSGEEFSCIVKDKTYDAVFMDIIMEGQNGIEAARLLREITLDTLLVFVTSSPEYMAQAFPCHAFDYIIKPYTELRDTHQTRHTEDTHTVFRTERTASALFVLLGSQPGRRNKF